MTQTNETSRLAAIVFDRDEPGDAALAAFLAEAARSGARIGGLVQEGADDELCALHDVRVRDLMTGETLPIMQNLGAEATGCRVDPAAIAIAARMLDRAREAAPDLLVVNRFGRLETEGGGMLAEIGQAFADGLACADLRAPSLPRRLGRFRRRARRQAAAVRRSDHALVGGSRPGPVGRGRLTALSEPDPPRPRRTHDAGPASIASAHARSSGVLTLKNGSIGLAGHSTVATR